tara:strand:- start:1557 stop:1976 length:420 start_codon:yes stop_codon:yes gene_type:complete
MQNQIKEIKEGIESLVRANFDEITFVQFTSSPDRSLDKKGVSLYFDLSDALTSDLNVDTVSFSFEMLDLLSTIGSEDKRRLEVISDTFAISSMFISYLKSNGYYFQDSTNISKVEKRYKDGLGGVEFTISFNLQKTCLI